MQQVECTQAGGPVPSESLALLHALFRRVRPLPSEKPFIGPVITGARQLLWRLLGLRGAFLRMLELPGPLPNFPLREGSDDLRILCEVVLDNVYQLPDSFQPDDLVIDIGTHIGCFGYAALMRGCRQLVGFEMLRTNYEVAVQNLSAYGSRVRIFHKAVWRSDRGGDRLFHADSIAPDNTGGYSLVWQDDGVPLEVIALDDILDDVTAGGRKRVRLLKIDCEASEFPILLTSRLLHRIDEVCGEFHEVGGPYNNFPIPARAQVAGINQFTIQELVRCLESAGFNVRWQRHGRTSMGQFFARRAA
jgi:FkbM family methyltransferase